MPHLELTSLGKRFGNSRAVADFNLAVERGSFVSLLGPSGCGKTTTLRMVAGFLAPSEGRIALDGAEITRAPVWARNFGFVFQNYALFPHMTAAENVAFGLKVRRIGRAERDARVHAALDMVGLAALAGRWPAQLSGGQQQRVALARALVIEPELLLLDEPLSNLDAALRAEMRDEIGALQKRLGITTLFVTHDQEEALSLSDLVVVMNQGRLVEAAAPEQLSEQPRRLFTAHFLGARSVLPGRAEAGLFTAACGLRVALSPQAPAQPSHLVLRASRLALLPADAATDAPLAHAVTVEETTYLGDARRCTVRAGAERIHVLLPSTQPRPAPGARMTLSAPPEAIAFLDEPAEAA
jgi:putative spermidine/putrescine transport system ATP-binding protein